ncbi:hypothetical protein F441_02845 [Phytophthora nicotianae CJ01A1]|uniref:Uncharacterized protein n=5 Tax=Phytophthora nicotianae TaxID=4792 RepID=V9DSA9_PHYNI|nr:hypothetical protein F443_23103 [Phytophthora nicotianae P1569]ETK94150.1 hypothetical protein L915_02750 [Phytophthora nicotianae]ETO83013.1 hypothetical protein F444_02885 [Phytophthora nicotianae P1976]ETP24115.1 hypothetical protein F441_02845 [Phytophthora nicotianae CJ01A1]ETP52110.1 hypothetical protein F442_02842 [Phytophthora nicotianae P10297]
MASAVTTFSNPSVQHGKAKVSAYTIQGNTPTDPPFPRLSLR